LKLFKVSLAWVRISVLCIAVIVTVIVVSRQAPVEKLIKRIITPALSTEQKWDLELDKTYTLCGHREVLTHSYCSLKSLKTALESLHGYQLKRISGSLYVYGTSIGDYCGSCRNHQFLGVNEQNVAVIRGTPENPGPVQEKTEIKIQNLPQLELEDLRKGIPVRSSDEKLQLIEGLKGLSAN
jgi:hypothetical protein